jgi:hypothetical protein
MLSHHTIASVADDTRGHSHQRERASGSHFGQLIVLDDSCSAAIAGSMLVLVGPGAVLVSFHFRAVGHRVLAFGRAGSVVSWRFSRWRLG